MRHCTLPLKYARRAANTVAKLRKISGIVRNRVDHKVLDEHSGRVRRPVMRLEPFVPSERFSRH